MPPAAFRRNGTFQVKETLVPFKQAANLGAHDFHRVLAQGFALGFEAVGSALGCLFQPVLGELAGFNALEGSSCVLSPPRAGSAGRCNIRRIAAVLEITEFIF